MVAIKMENEKFYKNTKDAPQNKMVTRFIKKKGNILVSLRHLV